MKEREKQAKKKYLFNVSIMVEGYSNGIALETLLHFLNQEEFVDYEVKEGIELGQKIRDALDVHPELAPSPPSGVTASNPGQASALEDATMKINSLRARHNAGQKPKENAEQPKEPIKETPPAAKAEKLPEMVRDLSVTFMELLHQYKQENTLVRLTILKGKGVKLSIPCRILNYEAAGDSLTVYHVDEKKVYQFRLTEVDDLSANN
jgi:hypothetical protein